MLRGVSTLREIEAAVPELSAEDLAELERFVRSARERQTVARHSVLDIAPVSLGGILRPLSDDDDLLGEMVPE